MKRKTQKKRFGWVVLSVALFGNVLPTQGAEPAGWQVKQGRPSTKPVLTNSFRSSEPSSKRVDPNYIEAGPITSSAAIVAGDESGQVTSSNIETGSPLAPEIAELARGLDHDIFKIFNYVRNHIRFEPYYGLQKGALMTLLEGSGNDFDQAVLLAALLRESGYDNIEYLKNGIRLPYNSPDGEASFSNWFGLPETPYQDGSFEEASGQSVAEYFDNFATLPSEEEAKQIYHVFLNLFLLGFPIDQLAFTLEPVRVVVPHVYLQVETSVGFIPLDPSSKVFEYPADQPSFWSVFDDYSRSEILAQPDVVDDPDYAQAVDLNHVDDYLDELHQSALSKIQADWRAAHIENLTGEPRIQPNGVTGLTSTNGLMTGVQYASNPEVWTEIPVEHSTSIEISLGGHTFVSSFAELGGRKLSLVHDGVRVRLMLDDETELIGWNTTASRYSVHVAVEHPDAALSQESTNTYVRRDDFVYSIIYGFEPSGALLQKRQQRLNAMLASGMDASSREAKSESLYIMGLKWLHQAHLIDDLISRYLGVTRTEAHRVGRAAQEEGYFVDVDMAFQLTASGGKVNDNLRDRATWLTGMFSSALEHAVIEQMQPGVAATSTVNLIRHAARRGQFIDLATPENWASEVRPQLIDYSEAVLAGLDSLLQAPGDFVLLPRHGSLDANTDDWSGIGYFARSSGSSLWSITGGYDTLNGGYSLGGQSLDSGQVNSSYNATTEAKKVSAGNATTTSKVVDSGRTPSSTDPVEMRSGAFVFSHVDMTTGSEVPPRGLSFVRHYSSNLRWDDSQHLGHGWTHNWHIVANPVTAYRETLGLGTTEQAALLLTALLAANDLFLEGASPLKLTTAMGVAGWFTDRIVNKAYSVTIGRENLQFVRNPDGSYLSPAGSTMTLEEFDGGLLLKQRLGNTIEFLPNGGFDYSILRASRLWDQDGQELTIEWTGLGRVKSVEDCYGRRYSFSYLEAGGPLKSVTDSSVPGRLVTFGYDFSGNLSSASDPEIVTEYYDYGLDDDFGTADADDHLMVRIRDDEERTVVRNLYDSLHRVSEQYVHGEEGRYYQLGYTGWLNWEDNPLEGRMSYRYDARGRTTAQTDPSGHVSITTFDGQSRVIERLSATGERTTFTYDNRHNLLRLDLPRGGGTALNTYDELNRLVVRVDAEGNRFDYTYAEEGLQVGKDRPVEVVDPMGTTSMTYAESGPAVGRVLTTTDDDGLVISHTYGDNGLPASLLQPHWTSAATFSYDVVGNLVLTVDPRGKRTTYDYNLSRQVTRMVDGEGTTTEAIEERTYDDQGRLESVTSAADNDDQRVKRSYRYSATGKLTHEFLANETAGSGDDLVATYVYDVRNWLVSETDAEGRTVEQDYYPNGWLRSRTAPGERSTRFNYDGNGRVVGKLMPGAPDDRQNAFAYDVTDTEDGDQSAGYPRTRFLDLDEAPTSSEFDRLGRLRYYHNKADQTFTFAYDGLGRRTHTVTPGDVDDERAWTTGYLHRGAIAERVEPSGDTTNYTYEEGTGRLLSVSDPTGTITYSDFDVDGVALTTTESFPASANRANETITRTRDAFGRISSYTDVNGNMIGYEYYLSGKLAKVIYPGGSTDGPGFVAYTYWNTGRLKNVVEQLTEIQRITSFYWNNDGRLERMVRPNGTEREITYDDAGLPAQVVERAADETIIYRYNAEYFDSDDLKSLTEVPVIDPSLMTSAPSVGMTYDTDNRLTSFLQPFVSEPVSVTHDADGNMTYGPLARAQAGFFQYDSRNRLVTTEGASYRYDAEGVRLSATINGVTQEFVTDPNQGLSKVLSRTIGASTQRYVWGVGLLYEINDAGEAVYYHFDSVGSTIALSNQAGAAFEQTRYSPYGNIVYRSGDYDTPFLFTGFWGIQKDVGNLLYVRARYYSSITRRFVNSDPAQDGWNWYAYGNENPIGFVDPTGLEAMGSNEAIYRKYSEYVMMGLSGAGSKSGLEAGLKIAFNDRASRIAKQMSDSNVARYGAAALTGAAIGAIQGAVAGGVILSLPAAVGGAITGAVAGAASLVVHDAGVGAARVQDRIARIKRENNYDYSSIMSYDRASPAVSSEHYQSSYGSSEVYYYDGDVKYFYRQPGQDGLPTW